MSAGWVAGTVRARVLASRRIGVRQARLLARCDSLPAAVSMLDATGYRLPAERMAAAAGAGEAATAAALSAAQHAISAALLWDLRVLAGWLPQGGTPLMRVLAGWFEIGNVAERLAELAGHRRAEYFELGSLATAWPRLRDCQDLAALRSMLAASAWRDPGGDTASDLAVGIRARWAQRVAALGNPAQNWAETAVALLLAGELLTAGRPGNPVLQAVARELLGPASATASTVGDLAGALPSRASWVLTGTGQGWQPWHGEVTWWRRVERDGQGMLAGTGFDHKPVIGAAVVLAADARRVRSALELAARGGGQIEVFDAVA